MIPITGYEDYFILSSMEVAFCVITGIIISVTFYELGRMVMQFKENKKAYKASLTDKELRKYQEYLDK